MSINVAVELRPIGLDSLSELRHVHTTAFRSYLGSELSENQLDALIEFVHTPEYAEHLMATECLGAWIDKRLCASASWTPGGNQGASAKLIGVCVDPLFGGLGLSRRLVAAVEARARRAGYAVMTARSPVMMASFFERLGYSGSSRGVWVTPCGVTIPVLHMRKGEVNQTPDPERRFFSATRGKRPMPLSRVH